MFSGPCRSSASGADRTISHGDLHEMKLGFLKPLFSAYFSPVTAQEAGDVFQLMRRRDWVAFQD